MKKAPFIQFLLSSIAISMASCVQPDQGNTPQICEATVLDSNCNTLTIIVPCPGGITHSVTGGLKFNAQANDDRSDFIQAQNPNLCERPNKKGIVGVYGDFSIEVTEDFLTTMTGFDEIVLERV